MNQKKISELGAKSLQNNQKVFQLELGLISSIKQLQDHKNEHYKLVA